MRRTTLAGLRPRRLVPTALAIVLAVGFVAGIMIFGDTTRAALLDDYARAARNVDLAVTAKDGTRLPLSTVDDLRRVAGVASVEGRMAEQAPLIDRKGRLVTEFGVPGHAVDAGERAELRPFDLRTGRLPQTGGEAALDARSARSTGYQVGDTIVLVGADEQRHEFRLAGIVDITGVDGGNTSTVVLTRRALVDLTGATGYREVVATVADGTAPTDVRARVSAPGTVRTGDQLRHDLAREAFGQIDGLLVGMQLFAVVAVLVAALVIANTFTILLAQRMRETALLRCVGATRAQVFRRVVAEAAAVGLTGATLGIGLGVAIGSGLSRGAALPGIGLPSGPVVVDVSPVLVALVLGVALTVVSALVPAVRATRVPPVAALRVTPLARGGGRWGRVALVAAAALLALGGSALTAVGMRTDDPQTAMAIVMVGGTCVFLAVLLLSPLFIGPLVSAFAWLPGRVAGVPVRLAAANARRNPGRTAVTTAALLVGVALMAGGSTIAATVNRTAEAQLNQAFPVDYLLTPAVTGGDRAAAVPAEVTAGLRSDPAFDLVAAVRQGTAKTSGGALLVGTIDAAAIGTAYRPAVTAGRLADLRPGTAVVASGSDILVGRRVGDQLRLTTGARTMTVTIAATVQSATLVGDVVITDADFAALFPAAAAGDSLVMLRTAGGVAAATARSRLDTALAAHPLVQVGDLAEVRDERNAAIDQIVAVIAVLLALALVIALVGIANTLSLSVLERTRESALLRALGLTRGQLRATLLAEALLMAAAGAVVGVVFGLVYGWLTAEAAFGDIETLVAVPIGQLAAFVGLAALAGTLAAVLPSRRAANVAVVAALAD
ncbi:FtsX-like permease family protein [Dactylosporangium aurantiacum]|uniref:FtsX-like permease family protein n=1 Tax=Dactylosporangium aurantiacum TaxID=35754 RepID=A0A9Q9IA15_9ACTN|nr:ABC transporter permease [Dactylosporangium aurantiacum]MDG6101540.1 FtsX-like permease family protein [Dactylosporangium aurantiacum]UWZ52619.1 FtsX-like permease family protein [Dactylosporangium aurantiacum]